MGQYRIKSEPLGVDFMVEGDQAPNAKSTFQILKQVVSPDKMIKAYEGGHKQLAREAFKNGYFDQEQDSDLYDVFKQAAGEVLEGFAGTTEGRPAWMDVAAPLIVMGQTPIWELPGKLFGKKKQATGYQALAEAFAGYKTIGDIGKLGFSKMVGEGDEDVDASIEFIKGMMETQSFIDDGAAIMAEYFGDIDMYNDLKSGRVEPNKKQAMAASLFVQPEGPLSATVTKGLSSTTNMLRRGTAKKLAEQLQNAEAKKLLYSQQLNRLSVNAPDNVVQSATDALKGATKEADEILEKLKPYTEQKAKAGAGITNKAIGKTMQGLGKAGEYVGNMTEFLRRMGIEEATTFLMRTGLSESAAKAVVFGTVGAGLDATDGEMSLGGSGLNALAAYMGPRALATMGRSTAILGKQLTIAESSLPFFKRVGALPADNPKLSEVIVDRTENLVLGDATSQLKPILTQSREIPSLVRGTARVLDRSGVGRVLTEGANLTKATVAGASIPGAFGYMAGGEEGAASAIGASAPFIAAGLGYGSLLRFSSNSDLIAKQLGDLEYHKQSMTEPELREFNKLKKDQQIAISTFSQFFPDVVIRVKSMGRDGPNGAQYVDGKDSVVEINSDSDNPLGVVLAHEIGHHIERHGLLPNILEELIGNAEKGRVGLFTKIDEKTGKPIVQTDANGLKFYELNQEFRDLQQAYIEKLERTNVSDKDRLRYETPEHFAREIFAEIVAERMLSGKTAKRARQSSTYKMIESLGERITSGGFKRKVMHSLGMATNKDGSIVKGTGVLNKAFRSSRELDNLVKRYEDETIGLSESEIREQRPVVGDDELDTVVVSPNDPIESLQAFNNGGHFKTNEDGSIKINPITRKPEVFTPAETRQANQALARDLIDAIQARENDLPEGHVTLSETADGKLVGSGKFIDDSIIDELAKTNRYNASQISYLREASRAGREGQGNHMLLFYYAATGKGGRKYKTLKGGYRDSLVYGVTITKDGNVIFDTVSLDKLQKNVDYLLKRRGKEIAQAFGGSDDAKVRQNFESMFEKYLDNHAKGIINGDSNPESGITDKQRDFLNAAFGPVSKSQIADNPILSNLGERRANTLSTYRSRRLDRIGTIQPTGNTRNVVIDRLRRNLMPGRGEGDKLFMPQLAMQNDPNVKYHYDTKTMDRPPVKTITALSGERLAGVLEADRHDARGSRMAGPAHPFLKSNQVTAKVDGVEWKPVWANMKYQFVKTQIGKQLNSTNGYNLVAIMDEFAHRSNRDVFTRMMKKIQTASKKMTPEQKIITAQIINIFDIRYTPKKERTQALQSSMDSFISDLGTAKSQATRGNLDGFNQLLNKAVSKVEGKSWWSDNNVKSNSKDFRKYTKDMTFNKRGAILKALEGLPWLPDIQKFLKSEMDFEGAPTDKAILAVQLSKHKLNSDERVFAIYTGKDPEQAKWMTDNERKVLKQLRANPKFREHPSYDWMMLGRADADNFYLDQPVNLDKLIPSYRSDHKTFKKQEYKDQLSKTKKYFEKNPQSKGFLFSGKGDKADKAFIKTFLETKSKGAGIENVYKGKERLVVGAMKRNSKVPIIIP